MQQPAGPLPGIDGRARSDPGQPGRPTADAPGQSAAVREDGCGRAAAAGSLTGAAGGRSRQPPLARRGHGGPRLAQLFQIGVEHRLLVRLEHVAVAIGGLQVLGGQLELLASPGFAELNRRDPASRYLIGGTGGGCRVAEVASSGAATAVAPPHVPRIKMRLTVLSLPNATSFPPLATTAADVPGDGLCPVITSGRRLANAVDRTSPPRRIGRFTWSPEIRANSRCGREVVYRERVEDVTLCTRTGHRGQDESLQTIVSSDI